MSAAVDTVGLGLPLLTETCLFNYLDRVCLGFAALTINKEIGRRAA